MSNQQTVEQFNAAQDRLLSTLRRHLSDGQLYSLAKVNFNANATLEACGDSLSKEAKAFNIRSAVSRFSHSRCGGDLDWLCRNLESQLLRAAQI